MTPSKPPTGPTSHVTPARLMASVLNPTMLGRGVTADCYVRNGFRFVKTPAQADRNVLESQAQGLRNRVRMGMPPARLSIATGYDDQVPIDDALGCVQKLLRDPRERLLSELFWPHVDDSTLELLRSSGTLSCAPFIVQLEAAAEDPDPLKRALVRHALGVCYHNQAIAEELEYRNGKIQRTNGYWEKAMRFWAEALAEPRFWEYLKQRVTAMDDPRVRVEDVDELQQTLPMALLAFHAMFARDYAASGDLAGCRRHLLLISHSNLPRQTVRDALCAAVRNLIESRLTPLVQRAERGPVAGDHSPIARAQFAAYYEPIIRDAEQIHEYLRNQLKLADGLMALVDFDAVCGALLTAIDKRLDYRGPDRERSFVYSSLLIRRLLHLPASPGMRERLQQSMRSNSAHCYWQWPGAADLDVSKCWFLEGELADPDASLILPLYHIVSSQGGNVRWETRRVIIPRSAMAAKVHNGSMREADIAKLRNDAESRQLRDRLEKLKAGLEAQLAQAAKQVEDAVAHVLEEMRKQLTAFEERHAAQDRADRQHVDHINAQKDKAIQQEQHRLAKAQEQCRAEHEPALQAARDHDQQQRSGIGGFFRKLFGKLDHRAKLAQQALDQALAALDDESRARIQKIEEAAQRHSADAQKRLAHNNDRRRQIRHQADQKVVELRTSHDHATRKLRDQVGGEVAAIERQLAARVKVRPERDKMQHPAFTWSKSNGYKDGERPSDRDMHDLFTRDFEQFMSSLDMVEREILARLHQQLSPDEFAGVLMKLMEMPANQRRELLYKFLLGR